MDKRSNNVFVKISFLILFIISIASCNTESKATLANCKEKAAHLLPSPQHFEILEGTFQITKNTQISYPSKASKAVSFFQKKLKQISGYQLKPSSNFNSIIFKENTLIKEEGYYLNCDKTTILIEASSEAGYFYGMQTLLQLMNDKIWSTTNSEISTWTISNVNIKDQPKHHWRSFMLDSGREFQTMSFIKSYLDYMAMLKMNVFHWHITEGRAWRIEIKKYPKLTQIGASSSDGPSKGKFYTQEDIKEIVRYASERHIKVVPEIDVPGHSEAALTAYPEHACLGAAPESVMAFSSTLFCGGREETYVFLQDIFDEVCELFPSQYIHIGGDEAPKKTWKICPDCQSKIKTEKLKNEHELQIYFTNRIAAHLKQKGRKAICWGDVVHQEGPKLESNIVINWWNWRGHKDKALKESIKQNLPIICGTNYYSYLNFPVTPWSTYKKNRTFDLKTTYEKNPSNLDEETLLKSGNVLGMSASLWTDWYVNQNMIDRRVFPRIYSLAEQMWSKATPLPFNDFHEKVKSQYSKLTLLGIDYGPAMETDITPNYSWE